MAEAAKSKSGPSASGQLALSTSIQELFQASPGVSCFDHRTSLLDIRSATTASLSRVGGSE
jgi:hypothetical protein